MNWTITVFSNLDAIVCSALESSLLSLRFMGLFFLNLLSGCVAQLLTYQEGVCIILSIDTIKFTLEVLNLILKRLEVVLHILIGLVFFQNLLRLGTPTVLCLLTWSIDGPVFTKLVASCILHLRIRKTFSLVAPPGVLV